jgi:transcriptional regulator with XRE-family HTH domain
MATPSPVGRKLHSLRRRRKLSLRGLAALSRVPFTTIHGLERGYQQRTSIAVAQRLAVVLGADLSDLVPELRTG